MLQWYTEKGRCVLFYIQIHFDNPSISDIVRGLFSSEDEANRALIEDGWKRRDDGLGLKCFYKHSRSKRCEMKADVLPLQQFTPQD